jgi:hypothetical protein
LTWLVVAIIRAYERIQITQIQHYFSFSECEINIISRLYLPCDKEESSMVLERWSEWGSTWSPVT